MKSERGAYPVISFRCVMWQNEFNVVQKQGMMADLLGSLSYGQLMREAYPGAVYYYATVPYRVNSCIGELTGGGGQKRKKIYNKASSSSHNYFP